MHHRGIAALFGIVGIIVFFAIVGLVVVFTFSPSQEAPAGITGLQALETGHIICKTACGAVDDHVIQHVVGSSTESSEKAKQDLCKKLQKECLLTVDCDALTDVACGKTALQNSGLGGNFQCTVNNFKCKASKLNAKGEASDTDPESICRAAQDDCLNNIKELAKGTATNIVLQPCVCSRKRETGGLDPIGTFDGYLNAVVPTEPAGSKKSSKAVAVLTTGSLCHCSGFCGTKGQTGIVVFSYGLTQDGCAANLKCPDHEPLTAVEQLNLNCGMTAVQPPGGGR